MEALNPVNDTLRKPNKYLKKRDGHLKMRK
jgi:hypothetical protein